MVYEIDFTHSAFTKAIRIDDKDTEYKVKNKNHLRLMVYINRKTLMVRHCFEGQRISKKMGTFPMMKLPTFELVSNEVIEAVESGGNHILGLRATLDDYFYQVWLPNAKQYKRSFKDDESRYRLHVSSVIGGMKLARIKPYHVSKLLNTLPAHLSDRSHDLILSLMSTIFKQAIIHELININPCRTSTPINHCNVKERYMDEPEYTSFILSCLIEADVKSDQFSIQSLCLLLALFTAMRIGNCIQLKRSMLSTCKTEIYLPASIHKSKKPQTVYLSSFAQWIINQALSVSDSEFIFPQSNNKSAHISRPTSAFKRICTRAGIACAGSTHPLKLDFSTENLTIHCLRKTLATVIRNQTSSEVSLDEVAIKSASLVLGHAGTNITATHYAFSDGKRERSAVEIASQVLLQNIKTIPNPAVLNP